MSEKDRQKWDDKYIVKSQLLKPREASENIRKFVKPAVGAKALDLACGAGRNTIYLAKQGYAVDALDIAAVALKALSEEAERAEVSERVNAQLNDLDTFVPAAESYELIIMMNFLDRALIERAKAGLKRGGLFIVETYMDDESNEKESSSADNLLKQGELKSLFGEGWELLHYDEFENEAYELYRMQKQVLVARKR
jgi:tellurite methyltransferase